MFPLLAVRPQCYSTTHRSLSSGILWCPCLRRCVTPRTFQVTTCIRFLGQLNNDLRTPAVNLMFSLAVYAPLSPSCSPPARSDQVCLQPITSFVAAQAARFLPLSIYVRSWTLGCHDRRLSVSNPKECAPTSNHRLSEMTVLIIHICTTSTWSTLRTPSRTTANTHYNTYDTMRD